MLEHILRALKVPEGCRAFENADGKEQHQQSVANGLHGPVDGRYRTPDRAALKGLGRFCQQRPHLCQLLVPCGQRIFQIVYDPVVVQVFTSY